MEDPKLIVSLIPVDDLTKHVFSYKQNNERYVPPAGGFNDDPVVSSRESTPAYVISQTNHNGGDGYERMSRLLLNFDQPPKDPSKGFAFGTDKQRSDVVLAPRGVRGTSGIHFHISFDVINNEKRLVLRDSSTNGTAVSYDGQAKGEVRHHFTWILDLPKGKGERGGPGSGRSKYMYGSSHSKSRWPATRRARLSTLRTWTSFSHSVAPSTLPLAV